MAISSSSHVTIEPREVLTNSSNKEKTDGTAGTSSGIGQTNEPLPRLAGVRGERPEVKKAKAPSPQAHGADFASPEEAFLE